MKACTRTESHIIGCRNHLLYFKVGKSKELRKIFQLKKKMENRCKKLQKEVLDQKVNYNKTLSIHIMLL